MESKFSEDSLVNSYSIKPSLEKGEEIKEELNSDEFTNLEESFQKEILKRYSSIFNVTYRSNSRVETLRENILAEIEKDDFIPAKSLSYPISFLGSREFENIDSFFENTFFKELKEDIWDYRIDGKSIGQHIDDYIDDLRRLRIVEEIEEEVQDSGMSSGMDDGSPGSEPDELPLGVQTSQMRHPGRHRQADQEQFRRRLPDRLLPDGPHGLGYHLLLRGPAKHLHRRHPSLGRRKTGPEVPL